MLAQRGRRLCRHRNKASLDENIDDSGDACREAKWVFALGSRGSYK